MTILTRLASINVSISPRLSLELNECQSAAFWMKLLYLDFNLQFMQVVFSSTRLFGHGSFASAHETSVNVDLSNKAHWRMSYHLASWVNQVNKRHGRS
jgi:hypothetical protein